MNDLTDTFHSNGVRIAVIGVLAILALFLLVETLNTVNGIGRSGVPATDTITVTGTGMSTVAPDIARITFTVQNTADTVAAAQTKTTDQTNAALDFVKGKGIAEKDVRTLSYNISPHYTYPVCTTSYCPPRDPKITGYDVMETIEVKVHDLTKVGDVLQGLGSLGVQNVSGPSFGLDDTTAGYDAARADAIAKAKTQASLLSKQLGVRLGKIVNFSESSGGYPYPTYAYGMGGGPAADKAVAPSVPTGENTYSATVTITYEIR